MMREQKAHLVRKKRFLTKKTEEVKRVQKPKTEQEIACSHSKQNQSHSDKIDRSSPNETDPIPIDAKQTQQDTKSQTTTTTKTTTEQNTTNSPKTSPEIGIFDKISSIWTNKNENTASDAAQKTNKKPDLVKNFKKFFKS